MSKLMMLLWAEVCTLIPGLKSDFSFLNMKPLSEWEGAF